MVIHMLLSVIPLMVLGLATMVWLFMLLFMRRKLYGWIDRRAGSIITPDGLFSKVQLQGIIPLLLFWAALYFPAMHAFGEQTDITTVLLQLLGFGLCGAYCRWWVVRKSRTMPRRKARMILLYAIMSICSAVAGAALAVYVIYLAVLLVIGYVALSVLGESGSGTSRGGSSSGETGSSNYGTCNQCSCFYDNKCHKYNYPVSGNDPACHGFEGGLGV